MGTEEKIRLSVEDVSDVSMAFSLFDQDDRGFIDLESLEAALFQITDGDEASTFLPPVKRLKEKSNTARLDHLIEETLVSEDDFEHLDGITKVFRLFDTDHSGYITREDFFEVIDSLSELGLM